MRDRRTNHERLWDYIHPAIKEFFTNALVGYQDTSRNQNYIGAEACAYSRQMLPCFRAKGPGEIVLKQLIATSPQVYVQQMVVPTGLAGIAAGQIWNGQMFDNPLGSANLSGQEIV